MEEVKSFLHNHAVPNAARQLSHLSFIETPDKNCLVVGANTKLHSIIDIEPNGHINLSDHTRYIRIKQFQPQHLSLFAKAHDEISFRARSALSQEIQTFLNLNDSSHKQRNQDPKVQDLIQVYHSDQLREEINKASANVTNAITSGYVADPSRLGYSKLYQLIGKDRVSYALHVAGTSVILHQLNIINSHKQLIDQAHRINPNAVVAWFTALCPGDSEKYHPTTDSIIQEASTWFQDKCLKANLNNTQELWQVFTQLNPSAIRQFPSCMDEDAYSNLCQRVLEAGVTATYSAITNLIRESYLSDHTPTDVHNYLARSRRRADNPNAEEPQKALWQQFMRIQYPLYTYPSKSNTPARKTKTATHPKPSKKAPSKQQLASVLNTPQVQTIIKEASESITLATVPGIELSLNATGQDQPALLVQREPSGEITIHTRGYWTGGCTIPHPKSQKNSGHGWNTRGMVQAAATKAVHRFIKENWKDISPGPNLRRPSCTRIADAVRKILQNESKDNPPPFQTDDTLSEQMHEAMKSLVDLEAWTITGQLSIQTTPALYNMAATLNRHIPHLNQTNPGALIWAFTQTEPTGTIRHPGQLITMVKESMANHGLETRNWKFAATLHPDIMDTITRGAPRTAATILLNAMARNQATRNETPNTTVLRSMATELIPDLLEHEEQPAYPRTTTANTQTLASLMCQESHNIATTPASRGQHALLNEAQDIKDYVKAMNLQGIQIRSTTWNGIVQASNRWHRQLRREEMLHQWNMTIEQRQGWYHAWDSAIAETQVGEYTVTPLTDEKQLLQESTAMDHCVFDYASTCAKGQSRIFSITAHGQRIATSQIRQDTSNNWRVAQTRGPHNDPVPRDIERLMKQVLNLYQQEYDKPQQGRTGPGGPAHWYVNQETGQTSTTFPVHQDLLEDKLPF